MAHHPLIDPVEPAPHRGVASGAALAFGLIGGPLAWGIEFVVGYFAVSDSCRLWAHVATTTPGTIRGTLVAIAVVAALVAAAAALVALLAWRRTRGEATGAAHTLAEVGNGRTRFLAWWGILSGSIFLVVIGFTFVGLLGLSPCAA